MPMNEHARQLPRFKSEAEERAFWEAKDNDSTEYLDWTNAQEAVLPNLKPSTKTGRSLRLRRRVYRDRMQRLPAGPVIMSAMDEVFGLFPTPILRAPGVLSARLVEGLVQHFSALALEANKKSSNLSHTAMLNPADNPLFVEATERITPKIADMGALMFGQRLGWSIKEMWVNVLDTGGHQTVHRHANSFISGVIYLTTTHPGSQTLFMKSAGGTEFVFKNEHANIAPTAFNSDRWVSPAPTPGDLMLFPSYVMHAVPPNQGPRRISLAFNAIPDELNSWGYMIKFG